MDRRFALWTGLPLLVLGLLSFFFLSGNEAHPTKTELHIVAFGDSLTAGYGVSPEESYPAVLEQALKQKGYTVRVENLGVSGEMTEGGLLRAPTIAQGSPDLVLLGLGENDALRHIPLEDTERNLRAMLEVFREAKVPVVLLGMKSPLTSGLGNAQKFNAIYPRLANAYDLPLVPFLLEGVALRKELNIEDGIHPNGLGYKKIVEENLLSTVLSAMKALK